MAIRFQADRATPSALVARALPSVGSTFATAVLAVALGVAVVANPLLAVGALAAGAAGALGLLVERFGAYAVCGVLVFLTFQDLLLAYLPKEMVLAGRYGPEFVIDLIVLVVALTRFSAVAEGLRSIQVAIILLATFWLLSAIWAQVSPSTALIGLRSEFRFLPLLALPLVSARPREDARLYGRVIVLLGGIEALLAWAQYLGGAGVRSVFTPQYQVTIGGLTVGNVAASTVDIVGTFGNRNLLGIFLAFSWLVLVSAGSEGLGFSRNWGRVLGAGMVIALFMTGSREGAVALLLSALVLGSGRFKWPALRLTAGFAIIATVLFIWLSPPRSTSSVDTRSLLGRWTSLFSSGALTANKETNFRLFFLQSSAGIVARESPIFGKGPGVASDPRLIQSRESPVFRTAPGHDLTYLSAYIFDGNWAILVLEMGFGGIILVAVLLGALYRLGTQVRREHWSGVLLMALVIATAALGFFGPILQHRAPMAIMWLFVGIASALVVERRMLAQGPG